MSAAHTETVSTGIFGHHPPGANDAYFKERRKWSLQASSRIFPVVCPRCGLTGWSSTENPRLAICRCRVLPVLYCDWMRLRPKRRANADREAFDLRLEHYGPTVAEWDTRERP